MAQQLLVGATMLAVLGWLVVVARRHQAVLLGFLLLVTVLEATRDFSLTPVAAETAAKAAWYIAHSGTFLELGTVELRIFDVLTVVALLAGVIGLRDFRGSGLARLALASLFAMVAVGLVSFAIEWGIEPAVNGWRRWLLALSLFLFAATAKRAWRWSDLNLVAAAGLLMCALAAIEISIHGLGSAYGWVQGAGVRVNGRPVAESGTFVILAAAWVVVLHPARWGSFRVLALLTLLGFVVICQQRTTWIAAAASVAIWWIVQIARSQRFTLPRLGWSFTAGTYGLVGLAAMFASVWQLRESLGQGQTYEWRVARWRTSLSTARSSLEWLIGGVFGPTPVSVVRSQDGTTYAHSLYVWAVETVGLVGLAALLVLIASTCLSRAGRAGRAWPLVVGVIALAAGWSYGVSDWFWLLLGASAGWALANEPSFAAEPAGSDRTGSGDDRAPAAGTADGGRPPLPAGG